jgi:hypothetical protein
MTRRTSRPAPRAPLTLDRIQTIRLRCAPEYSYFVAIMIVRPNAHLGLGIKTINQQGDRVAAGPQESVGRVQRRG